MGCITSSIFRDVIIDCFTAVSGHSEGDSTAVRYPLQLELERLVDRRCVTFICAKSCARPEKSRVPA